MAGDAQARLQPGPASAASFDRALSRRGLGPLTRARASTLQVNVGKLCNQACHHCHVDAGPARVERMERATAVRVLELLARSPGVRTLDLTGGAPELNRNFRMLVEGGRRAGRAVMVRCNLTVMFEPGMERLGEFYRDNGVVLVCSLPCYSAANVERQRGRGVFEKSIAALRKLNALGYGAGALELSLVYNPVGPALPPPQAALEADYRRELGAHDVRFNRLLTIANMPIARFAHQLHQWDKYADYMGLLVNHFNPGTVAGLMCRALVSVGWDGRLYDCDFNQMLEMSMGAVGERAALTVWDIDDLDALTGAPIATGAHCFGCTAGAGSSCGGALVDR
ncbi:MAG TPA: arsenosugar biosynthesis radical SAM (seleno)protein ArsS [Candidatus Binataceae bacterium]|nr:arsenosugar biosynthesis radical SAM (seleno)protein ArsS [Candidatus Binataceae bacterium]